MTEFILRDSRSAGMVLHPSTQVALEALKEVKGYGLQVTAEATTETCNLQPVTSILDVGCGSGLLSLAALELWPNARILAADISEKAVDDAKANLGSRAEVVRANAFDHAEIRARAPYDLILCNLLADILIRAATDLKSHLAPHGIAVLSGILAWMQPQVVQAYQSLGFEILEEIEMSEWRGLVVGLRLEV